MTERRRMSSTSAPFYKYFLPIVWTVTGLPGVAVALSSGNVIFMVAWPCGWAFFLAAMLVLYAPLKNIEIDDENLYISSNSKTVMIPLSSIFAVDEMWMPLPASVTLKEPCEFGIKIRFIPAKVPSAMGRESSVHELGQLAARARRRPRHEKGEPTE